MPVRMLNVGLGDRSYEIHIGSNLLERSGEIITECIGKSRAVVLTDSNVWNLWGQVLERSLRDAGIDYFTVTVQPGEGSKCLETLGTLLEEMAANALTRSGMLIAFGGGVIGDLGGFAASVYMRGIRYVQIPTTLLSQVDSAVGGKTAVNLRHGKNLAGSFWQPRLVISDTDTLGTLPDREFAGGMAEVIKYGAIRSEELFSVLESHIGRQEVQKILSDIIYQCCDIKRQVVEIDELDTGERMILNLGHTFGHAIEKIGNYEKYNHGEAVAIGMVLAAKYGEEIGGTPKGTSDRIYNLCRGFDLPVEEQIDLELISPLVSTDKKADENGLKLILLSEIGSAIIYSTNVQNFDRVNKRLNL